MTYTGKTNLYRTSRALLINCRGHIDETIVGPIGIWIIAN